MATETQTSHQVRNVAIGRYLNASTAESVTFETGFKPRYICVENVDTGDKLEWFEGMADASAVKTVTAGTRTIITTLGITPNARGFKLDVDTDTNVTTEQISWIAIG